MMPSPKDPFPSIFSSIIHTFLKAIVAIIGVSCGLLIFTFFLFFVFSEEDENFTIKSHYTTTILPNGKNERKKISSKAPVILKISINGIIGLDKATTQNIYEMLVESREGVLKGDRVKALLIHINTPGGTVVDSEGIYRTIQTYKKQYSVPVYAYVDGLCASGGMYVASACDKIYASDSSLIGSVGVIMPPFFNVKGLMEKIGLDAKTLYAGKGKEDLSPFRTWNPGEEDQYKIIIDYLYLRFIDLVSTNRPAINRTRLISDYGAKVFSPDKATEYGFIDGYGKSLEDTLELLAKELGVRDQYYQVIQMDRKKLSFSDVLSSNPSLLKGKMTHQIKWPLGMDPQWMNQFLYLYLP